MRQFIGRETHLIARPGPQQYVCEPGAYDVLPDLITQQGWQRVLLLRGAHGYPKAQPSLPDLAEAVGVVPVSFVGECSEPEILRISAEARRVGAQAILGVGGGKILDTAKAAGWLTEDLPVILIPTLASNCAAWSPLSVLYEPDGTPLGHRVFPTQVKAVVVEPRVVFDSPLPLFVAGIADTLAKWYECRNGLTRAPGQSLAASTALAAAQQCRDVLLADAADAVQDMRSGAYTERWARVMETNILAGGVVGSFGGTYGRATAAHAIHDGVSTLPGAHGLLHGTKVAYGMLVQLALEKRWSEIDEVLPFYASLGLPTSLRDLGLPDDADAIRLVAEVSVLPEKTIHALEFPVTAVMVEDAIRALTAYLASTNQ
ncbi:MAG: iron-containing alcohol dehydrogenase family protein [Microbacteriaceae bacterium]|jgi:uncharacterized oxidoreductase|nr:iron-containing alcohol dehydrogenase family protein [Microbacteriaceae bacterium]MCI1207463.1 iron-containing alcohol dehydrogenase family protein [Microbacteriaceae bacterium]